MNECQLNVNNLLGPITMLMNVATRIYKKNLLMTIIVTI
jgi:hypothetical protein